MTTDKSRSCRALRVLDGIATDEDGAATTTQTIRLLDCPVCGEPIELHATYDVHPNEGIGIRATAKVVTATLTMTGVRVNHECPPPEPNSFFTGGGRHPRSFITIDNTGDPIGLNP